MRSETTDLRPWSITKSEWDGYGEDHPGSRKAGCVTKLIALLAGIGFMFLPKLLVAFAGTPAPPPGIDSAFRNLGIGFIAVLLIVELAQYLSRRRWRSIRPIVWESHGCVCPWCKVRVDEQPCARHGFAREDQPKLVAYWEALPTRASADAYRSLAELRRTARRRPLVWRVTEPFTRARLASAIAANDPTATPLARLRASLPWIGVKLGIGAIALAVALWLLPRGVTLSTLSGCWPYLLFSPLLVLMGPLVRVGRLRCTNCDQLCTGAHPTRCPECGTDLTKPAAVRRDEELQSKRLLLLIPLALAFLVSRFQDSLVGTLPTPLRNAYWTSVRPPYDYWQRLAPSLMTQAEVDEAALLLIECAKPGKNRPLFDFSFLDNAQKAGKLGAATLESAARAIVQATIEVERADEGLRATVRPAFGELILPGRITPRLVFGGVSVDGGPWSAPADWSLFLHDVEPFWRENGQLPALPEEKLVFRADLGELPAGTHTLRARCWIVLHAEAWVRYTPSFEGSGGLLPPAGATVYELPLETTFESR